MMDFSFLELPEDLIQAIGATLLHSLWQGLMLAVFAGAVIVFTRKASPLFRYNLLFAGLVIFCVSVISTFVFQMAKGLPLSETMPSALSTASESKTSIFSLDNRTFSDSQLFSFFNHHSRTIVIIWFLIVLARTIQLLTGLNSLHALRKNAVFNISSDLKADVQRLAFQMGIERIVSIAESAAIKVPMVIGHLKPLILIPIGLLTAIPPTAVEAIIIHELAHISRRDYLVNFMLSLIEIVLFFNPAVLWIASLIRTEREHCCDEIAVSTTGNQIAYVKALITCQEYNLAPTKYAIPFNGSKKHLLVRVKRILLKDNQSLNMIEKSLLSIGLVTVCFLSIAFSNTDRINGIVDRASEHMVWVGEKLVDDVEENQSIDSRTKPSQVGFSERINKDSTNSAVESRAYLNQVAKTESSPVGNDDDEAHLFNHDGAYLISSKEGNVGSLEVDGQTVPIGQHHKYVALVDSLRQVKVALPNLAALKVQLDQRALKLKYRADTLRKYRTDDIHYIPRKSDYKPKSPVALPSPPQYVPVHDIGISERLAEAIVRDGLVKNVKSYKLTESELILNGKKVDDNAFQSFKSRYMDSVKKGMTVYYKYDTSSTTI